jgi:hypothetical protein
MTAGAGRDRCSGRRCGRRGLREAWPPGRDGPWASIRREHRGSRALGSRPRTRDRRQHWNLRDGPGGGWWVEAEGYGRRPGRCGGRRLAPIQRKLLTQDRRRRPRRLSTWFAGRAIAVWRQFGAASQALGHGGMKGRMGSRRKKRAASLSARRRLHGARHLVTRSSRSWARSDSVESRDFTEFRKKIPPWSDRGGVPVSTCALEVPCSRCQTPRYGPVLPAPSGPVSRCQTPRYEARCRRAPGSPPRLEVPDTSLPSVNH